MTTVTRDRAGKRLIVEREVRGSAPLVWACWTEADRLREWWGPHDWRTDVLELDLRVGGRWRYRLRPDREHDLIEEHWGTATYEIIDAPTLLRFLDASSSPDGSVTAGSEMPTNVRITPSESRSNGRHDHHRIPHRRRPGTGRSTGNGRGL